MKKIQKMCKIQQTNKIIKHAAFKLHFKIYISNTLPLLTVQVANLCLVLYMLSSHLQYILPWQFQDSSYQNYLRSFPFCFVHHLKRKPHFKKIKNWTNQKTKLLTNLCSKRVSDFFFFKLLLLQKMTVVNKTRLWTTSIFHFDAVTSWST